MPSRRFWNISLALVIALAVIVVAVAAGWPAHRHAQAQNSACNLCLIAQLPVIQPPQTAGFRPPVFRTWHRTVAGLDRYVEPPAASRPPRAPPA
jgi:hypothetical protein